MKNKKKQGKRWKKMIKKIKKRVHRDKYMIPMTKKELKARQKQRHREKYHIPLTEEELAEREEERLEPEPKEVIVKKIPMSMSKCRDLQAVVTHIRGHKRQTYVCLDKPPKKQKKKQQGSKKSKPKKPKEPKPKSKKAKSKKKTVEPVFEPEPLQDIERIREFKARPARKFASTWPGNY